MPSQDQDQRIDADPEAQSTTDRNGLHQLALRLFACVDNYVRNPPERALWRELLSLALTTIKGFEAGGRTISAAAVHHVAVALYLRANHAGRAHVTRAQLAADCHVQLYVITCALIVLRRLHVITTTQTSRRESAIHELNAGGLPWTTVRARATAAHTTDPNPAPRLNFDAPAPTAPRGIPRIPLGTPERYPTDTSIGLRTYKGYVQAQPDLEEDRVAAAVPEGNFQQQQQPEIAADDDNQNAEERRRQARRADGLIAALASRRRKVKQRFNEQEVRDRLTAGTLTVDDLQRELDRMPKRNLKRDPNGMTGGSSFIPHQIIGHLNPGGICKVCGIRRPNRAEHCLGPHTD